MRKLNRDAVTAMIVIEMLTEGVYFDSRRIRGLPVRKGMIYRALKGLIAAGVVERTRARTKYLLTDAFLYDVRQEVTKVMPRGTFVHHPDLSVFEICGLGDWTADELNAYVTKLTQRWMHRNGAPSS